MENDLPIPLKVMKTQDEYVDFVSKYTYLAVEEMLRAQKKLTRAIEKKDDIALTEIAQLMPYLISAVNVVGFLRGPFFSDFRPRTPGIQDKLYENENRFEKVLNEMISALVAVGKGSEYRSALDRFYFTARFPDKP